MEQTFAKRADGNPAFEAYYKVGPDAFKIFEVGRVLFADHISVGLVCRSKASSPRVNGMTLWVR